MGRLGGVSGFTLVELCFTLTIVGLIVGLCWPALRTMSISIRARAEASAFADQLQVARERAVLAGITQQVPTPVGIDVQVSAREALLLPDGSARPLRVAFGSVADPVAVVSLDETGRVFLTKGIQ